MDELQIADVRCFRSDHTIPLAPLTFFVGENSTGKTTALAMARAAWDSYTLSTTVPFNDEPFMLGAYENIAHYHGGQGKRAKSFLIGFGIANPGSRKDQIDLLRWSGRFEDDRGQPRVCEATLSGSGVKVVLRKAISDNAVSVDKPAKSNVFIQVDDMNYSLPDTLIKRYQLPGAMIFSFDHVGMLLMVSQHETGQQEVVPARALDRCQKLIMNFRMALMAQGRPHAVAPIRSKPQRTYDPIYVDSTPEGSHVPGALAQLHDMRSLRRAGKAVLFPDKSVMEESQRIKDECTSNDSHVIALAVVSKARILCTQDGALMRDFKCAKLVKGPRGRVYRKCSHKALLRHHGSCEPK